MYNSLQVIKIFQKDAVMAVHGKQSTHNYYYTSMDSITASTLYIVTHNYPYICSYSRSQQVRLAATYVGILFLFFYFYLKVVFFNSPAVDESNSQRLIRKCE